MSNHMLQPSPLYRFFVLNPRGPAPVMRYYASEKERDDAAVDLIISFGQGVGPWDPLVRDVVAGELTHVAVRRGVRLPDPSEREDFPGIDYLCMFELAPVGAGDDPEPAQRPAMIPRAPVAGEER